MIGWKDGAWFSLPNTYVLSALTQDQSGARLLPTLDSKLFLFISNWFLLKGGGTGNDSGVVGVVSRGAAVVVRACRGQPPGINWSSSIAISPRHPTTVASISTCVNRKKWFGLQKYVCPVKAHRLTLSMKEGKCYFSNENKPSVQTFKTENNFDRV